jgi:predicted Zn-ribbon and HTH transcriptional regulator
MKPLDPSSDDLPVLRICKHCGHEFHTKTIKVDVLICTKCRRDTSDEDGDEYAQPQFKSEA